jgi:NAD(P)H-nitrite reductase large subunit
MSSPRRVVIIGHGVAGLTAAQAARSQDPAAHITIVGDEPYVAYYRPRLTHDLAHGIDVEKLRLRPAAWYEQQRVSVMRGVRATAIDVESQSIAVAGQGGPLAYDGCVLAMGSVSFMPPIKGGARPGVHSLRSAADAMAVRARAISLETPVAAIAGGGLLGLEAAHGLSRIVGRVLVLERGPWLLRRQLDREGGELLAAILGRAGIEVLTGAEVESAEAGAAAADSAATDSLPLAELTLKDGRRLPCGLLVVAAGVRPSVGLAEAAGVKCDRGGVLVDDAMGTSAAGVFACGDVASHPSGNYAIWPQAMAQGRVAGANAAGGGAAYRPVVPQMLLEVAGTSVFAVGEAGELAGGDGDDGLVEVGRRDAAAGHYVKLRLRGGALVGAMVIGQPELAKRIRGPVESRKAIAGLDDVAIEQRLEHVLSRV